MKGFHLCRKAQARAAEPTVKGPVCPAMSPCSCYRSRCHIRPARHRCKSSPKCNRRRFRPRPRSRTPAHLLTMHCPLPTMNPVGRLPASCRNPPQHPRENSTMKEAERLPQGWIASRQWHFHKHPSRHTSARATWSQGNTFRWCRWCKGC